MRVSELIDRCNREGFHGDVLIEIQAFANDSQQLVESKITFGSYLYEQGYLDMAQLLFEQAYAQEQTDELRILLADIYFEIGREDDAILLLSDVSEQTQAFIDATLLLAEIYASQGFVDVAVHKLQQLETEYLEAPHVQLLIGETYFAYGFFEEALEAFMKVDEQTKTQADVSLAHRFAMCWFEVGEYEQAEPFFKQLHEEGSETEADTYAYAKTLIAIEQPEQAKELLEQLLEVNPAFTEATAMLVELAMQGDDEQAALNYIDQGLKYNEFADQLKLQQAILLKKVGSFEKSEAIFKNLIMQYPNSFTIIKHLLELYLAQERYEELLAIIGELEALGEFDPTLEWYKAVAYNGCEEFDQASQQFEQAYYYLSDNFDFLTDYAKFLIEEGNRPVLKTVIQHAQEIDENDEFFMELVQKYVEDEGEFE
ncbi:MAG: tetratricopeptide repeat protein [Culicoidibacterales bacterium]